MSQNVVIVTYYLGRRKRGSSDAYTDEMWVVAVVRPESAVHVPPQPDRPIDSAAEPGKRLREAVDEVLAGDVASLVWKADALPEGQLDGFIAGLPDRLQALADQPLDDLISAIGMPSAPAWLASQVAGTMLLEQVMEPVEDAVHGFEVAGVVIGVLTGAHGLAFTCVEHLLHDMLGDLLSKVFSAATGALVRQPSAAASPEAADGPAEPANVTTSEVTPVAGYSMPRGLVIDPATGRVKRERDAAAEVADATPVAASPETQRHRSAREILLAVDDPSGCPPAVDRPADNPTDPY